MRGVTVALIIAVSGAADAQDIRAGQELYQRYCIACHGPDGRGDGPMVRVLTVDPPDLTQLAAGNGGSFPRARVIWRIDGRDPLLAHGNEMPVYGDLFAGRDLAIRSETGEVMQSAQPMADLIAWLEALQQR